MNIDRTTTSAARCTRCKGRIEREEEPVFPDAETGLCSTCEDDLAIGTEDERRRPPKRVPAPIF
jgi:hypothetical protein